MDPDVNKAYTANSGTADISEDATLDTPADDSPSLIQFCILFFQQSVVIHAVHKYPPYMESENSLPYSQKSAI
jgi:hypothetical protein